MGAGQKSENVGLKSGFSAHTQAKYSPYGLSVKQTIRRCVRRGSLNKRTDWMEDSMACGNRGGSQSLDTLRQQNFPEDGRQ